MNRTFYTFTIENTSTIFKALETLDTAEHKCLIVMDNNKVIGTITDGDIRRHLIKGSSLDSHIEEAVNTDYIYIFEDENTEIKRLKIIQNNKKFSGNVLPVISRNFELIDVITNEKNSLERKNIEALIFAGGEGKRLNPLTLKTPKPLIPIGGQPMIFRIINQLVSSGIYTINISVHYQYEKIIKEVGDGSNFSANINYIIEDSPMGTLGSVSKLDSNKDKPILLINSDILTNMSFNIFIDEFMNADIDMLMSIKEYTLNIPYGVIETDGSLINKFTEKPNLPFFISAGINIISPKLLKSIKKKNIDLPDILTLQKNLRVKPYLIQEYWTDIGNLSDLESAALIFKTENS
jgi:dTDP-glucose pyrophosphorylase